MDFSRFFRFLGACVVAAAFLQRPPAGADEASISLGTLETQIDAAPALQAAGKDIVAKQDAVGVETAKSGLDFAYDNAFGPRSDIIINSLNFNTVRYAQAAEVRLPILGTAIAQHNAIELARTDEAVARIALAEARRTRLSALREAYVLYWQYDGQQRLARSYADQFAAQLAAARSLRRSGFWTASNELDFLDSLTHFQTDERTYRNSRRQELAALASALGNGVPPFRPLEPILGAGCTPAHDATIRSAVAVDATLARITARTFALTDQANHVKGSSIDGHANAALANELDLSPLRGGYALTAGVDAELPTHARSEERSLRAELTTELEQEHLLAQQRLVEIGASAEAALDELSSARADLAQSLRNERSKRENVREAKVRFRTLSTSGSQAFIDVQTALAELFAAENETAVARATVYLKANALFLLAPDACT